MYESFFNFNDVFDNSLIVYKYYFCGDEFGDVLIDGLNVLICKVRCNLVFIDFYSEVFCN